MTDQAAQSIVINVTGSVPHGSGGSGMYVKPIAEKTYTNNILYYNDVQVKFHIKNILHQVQKHFLVHKFYLVVDLNQEMKKHM